MKTLVVIGLMFIAVSAYALQYEQDGVIMYLPDDRQSTVYGTDGITTVNPIGDTVYITHPDLTHDVVYSPQVRRDR